MKMMSFSQNPEKFVVESKKGVNGVKQIWICFAILMSISCNNIVPVVFSNFIFCEIV